VQPVKKRLHARVVQETHANVLLLVGDAFSDLKRYSFAMKPDLHRGRLER